jgi:hypothetical protein
MRRLTWILGVLALLASGCMTTLHNQGEVGFRWGTEITFFHRAAATSEETATAELEVPGVVEWVLGDDKPEPESAPEP